MSSFQAIFAPRSMQQRRVPGPCQSIPTAYGESGAVFPKKKKEKKMVNWTDKCENSTKMAESELEDKRGIWESRYCTLFSNQTLPNLILGKGVKSLDSQDFGLPRQK